MLKPTVILEVELGVDPLLGAGDPGAELDPGPGAGLAVGEVDPPDPNCRTPTDLRLSPVLRWTPGTPGYKQWVIRFWFGLGILWVLYRCHKFITDWGKTSSRFNSKTAAGFLHWIAGLQSVGCCFLILHWFNLTAVFSSALVFLH